MIGIAACDEFGGIGKNNSIPWKHTEDMKFFKRITSGHVVIMGRKTFDSIGRELPNRINLVMSKQKYQPNLLFNELQKYPDKEKFVIGGAQIYQLFHEHIDSYYITHIPNDYECDISLPHYFEILQWPSEVIEEFSDGTKVMKYTRGIINGSGILNGKITKD